MNQLENPLLLAIETSADICSVSISSENYIYVHYLINIKRFHDKLLAEITRRALNDLELELSSIDTVALSSGPGSFTGLRIGASFAKALCVDGSPKFISVPTLFAYSVASEEIVQILEIKRIHSIITANSGIIYHQLFDNKSNELSEIEMIKMNDFIENINYTENRNNSDLYVGNALELIDNIKLLNYKELNYMDAHKVSKAGWRLYKQGKFSDPTNFEPQYIQDIITK
ncbi:MAG TPA: tRNA (adenosine(37)-N6)-threonylcarbamoyltransferase complex dimerization subunit type 1 TsaB [Bacteroidota bacterium]|nr:tRNA (adenosine(37)-N6)-threonylcarbamoyltransferase complex dimerization subunit type 1 TsaB [Bacteroidota bacterium]